MVLRGMSVDKTHMENWFTASANAKNTNVYDPIILFLGVYPTEMHTCVHQKTCARMITAGLSIKTGNNHLSALYKMGK